MVNSKIISEALANGNWLSFIFIIILVGINAWQLWDKRNRNSVLKRILSKSKDIINAGIKLQQKMYFIDTNIIAQQMKYADNDITTYFNKIGGKYEKCLKEKACIYAFRYHWKTVQDDILDSIRRILKRWSLEMSLEHGAKENEFHNEISEMYIKVREKLENAYDDSIFPEPFLNNLDQRDFKDKMRSIFYYSKNVYNDGLKQRAEAIEGYTKEVSNLLK